MERQKVESSQIESIGYSADEQIVEVEFKGKTKNPLYRYYKVDGETAERFMAAPSKGIFLAQNIKGKFEFQRIDSEEVVKNV